MNLVTTARRIATANPGASLPCPLCASSVKGANLASHFAKVHANAKGEDARESWRGVDARILVTSLLLMIPALVGAVGTLALDLPRAVHAPFAIAFLLLLVLAFCGLFRLIPARVTLFDNAIVVRGLVARRAADLPCEIEMGTISESRPEAGSSAAEYNQPSVTYDAGTYLRFAAPREVIVACRAKAARLGAVKGPRRKSWDIELPRDAFVALQYALIERGLLAVEREVLAVEPGSN